MASRFAFISLILALSCIGIFSCDPPEEPRPDICFEYEVLPILVSNCSYGQCHNSIARAKNLDLTTYNGGLLGHVIPNNFSNSELYRTMASISDMESMTGKYTITQAQLDVISLWIDQGATNVTCGTELVDKYCNVPEEPSYRKHIKPIIENNCKGCHYDDKKLNGLDADGNGIIIGDYASLKETIQKGSVNEGIRFIKALNHDISGDLPVKPMPRNAQKLPDCTIEIIENWINNGLNNN